MKDTYKYSTLYSNNLNYLNNFYLKKNEKIEDVDIFDYILGIKTEDLIIYKEIYKDKTFTNAEWIQIMVNNPILIERPIIVNGDKAVIGRPPEKVLEIL